MEIIQYIKDEWAVLKKAPWSFVILLALGLGGGFAFGLFWRGQEVANYDTLIKLKDGQIDDYKKSINDRLDKVEKTLSANQLSSLELWLKTSPSKVVISSDPKTSLPYKEQILTAFKNSGWEVDPKTTLSDMEIFTLQTSDPSSASAVSKALSAAGVPFKSIANPPKGTIEFQLDK